MVSPLEFLCVILKGFRDPPNPEEEAFEELRVKSVI